MISSCGVWAAVGLYRLLQGRPPLADPEVGAPSIEVKINVGVADFDRKSGDDKTGVKAVDKKDESGSLNWETFEDEIKAEDDKANISAENMNDSTAENENPENSQNATNEIDEAKKV